MPAAGGMGLRQEEKTKEKQLIELICGAGRKGSAVLSRGCWLKVLMKSIMKATKRMEREQAVNQAAPLRGKPKQNQTFLFSAREEKLIVAAEEAAFSFCFILLFSLFWKTAIHESNNWLSLIHWICFFLFFSSFVGYEPEAPLPPSPSIPFLPKEIPFQWSWVDLFMKRRMK